MALRLFYWNVIVAALEQASLLFVFILKLRHGEEEMNFLPSELSASRNLFHGEKVSCVPVTS